MSRRSLVAVVVVIGVFISTVSRAGVFLALGAGLATFAVLVILSRLLARLTVSDYDHVDHFVPVLAGIWLMLMMLPRHSFETRLGAAATSQIAIQPVLELGYYTAGIAIALVIVRQFQPSLESARPPMLLLALPVWIACTGVWGATGIYAIVRAYQFSAFWFLAWATLCVAAHRPHTMDAIVTLVLRWFVRLVVALILVGFAIGPVLAPVSLANAGRFTWIAAHPNSSGFSMAMALVILVVSPRRVTRLAPAAALAVGGLIVVALYLNHSRTSWLCAAVVLVFGYVVTGRRNPRVLAIGGPFLALATAIVVIFHWDAVSGYVLRSDSSGSLATGNGRLELWGIGFSKLDTTFEWFCGLGYGITRTVFLGEASWAATSAHNSTVAMIVSTGLVGLVVWLITLGYVLATVVRSRVTFDYDLGRAVVGALLVVAVNSVATDVLAEPSLGIGMLYFTGVMAKVWMERPPDARTEDPDILVPTAR